MTATLKRPVDWDQLYPGRFLKPGEFLGKKVTLTMADIALDELEGDKGPQMKGIISFKETPKKLPLNKTNGICIREMFGKKLPVWLGKKVTLFPSTWNGEDCIRIWGSPDISADMEITVQLPRKKPIKMTMHKTGAKDAAPPPEDAPEPGSEG